ncbi:MAG: UbiX family flavin prenyltransferase [Proteobacteria bacterium]|nr:UbiX family flavin prenyltransferase [Pseudomonadota bacterium]MBU1710498.1 UbiX family flavin prenyltransferase [Pseudomonadota bacterium]
MKKVILAITGASGSLYAVEFIDLVKDCKVEIHGIISDSGRQVLKLELGKDVDSLGPVFRWYDINDFAAPMSSGSARFDAMIVLPCTMGTLAAIANGISGNLIHRAADVCLKEKRPLILAVRETPLNRTHLQNMLKAHDAGAMICPPMPSFYHKPQSIQEMARAFAGRLADQLGIDVQGVKRWGDEDSAE